MQARKDRKFMTSSNIVPHTLLSFDIFQVMHRYVGDVLNITMHYIWYKYTFYILFYNRVLVF